MAITRRFSDRSHSLPLALHHNETGNKHMARAFAPDWISNGGTSEPKIGYWPALAIATELAVLR